jgi:hypothetical protein
MIGSQAQESRRALSWQFPRVKWLPAAPPSDFPRNPLHSIQIPAVRSLMYVETLGRYEVRAFFFSDRNGNDDQAPAPLYRQFHYPNKRPVHHYDPTCPPQIEAQGQAEEATSAQETMPTYHLQRRIRPLVVCLAPLSKTINN